MNEHASGDKPSRESVPKIMVNGLCMAVADSVPGVSGGTIAFIMGFYERLLESIDNLFHGKGRARRDGIVYLVKLLAGWLCGMAFSMTILSRVLDSGVYVLSSAFLGLTMAAIPLIAYKEFDSLRGHAGMLVFTALGAALVVGLMLARQASAGLALDFTQLTVWQYLYVFIAGAVAVSAMILPGISGSSLLLIFGVYAPMVTALGSLMHLQLSVLPAVIVLACGILFGLALSVGVVRRLLQTYRPAMMYLILGLMAGSLFAIVMGPATMSVPKPPLSAETFNLIAFLAGGFILLVLEAIRTSRVRQTVR